MEEDYKCMTDRTRLKRDTDCFFSSNKLNHIKHTHIVDNVFRSKE